MIHLAKLYFLVLALTAGWALWVEVSLAGSNVEHMLPAMVLGALSLPSSLLIGPLYDIAPSVLRDPSVQLFVLCVVAVAQATAAWGLAKWLSKP